MSIFLKEAERHVPQIYDVCLHQDDERYEQLPCTSIDKGIAEKSGNIAVIPADFLWDDFGSLHAIGRHFPADENGNIVIGGAELLDTGDCTVCSDQKLTALIGVKDLFVLQADNGTVICSKDRIDDVQKLTSHLYDEGRAELL